MQRSYRSIQILSFVFGLLLLISAILQFVVWRDGGVDGATVVDDVDWLSFALAISSAGLLAFGLSLIGSNRPVWRFLSIGSLLLAVAYTLSIYSAEAQRREQRRFDQQWSEMVSTSQKADPHALPGGRPKAAPLRWFFWKFSLGIVGIAALMAGFGFAGRKHRGLIAEKGNSSPSEILSPPK